MEAQDIHLDFDTAPELWAPKCSLARFNYHFYVVLSGGLL